MMVIEHYTCIIKLTIVSYRTGTYDMPPAKTNEIARSYYHCSTCILLWFLIQVSEGCNLIVRMDKQIRVFAGAFVMPVWWSQVVIIWKILKKKNKNKKIKQNMAKIVCTSSNLYSQCDQNRCTVRSRCLCTLACTAHSCQGLDLHKKIIKTNVWPWCPSMADRLFLGINVLPLIKKKKIIIEITLDFSSVFTCIHG